MKVRSQSKVEEGHKSKMGLPGLMSRCGPSRLFLGAPREHLFPCLPSSQRRPCLLTRGPSSTCRGSSAAAPCLPLSDHRQTWVPGASLSLPSCVAFDKELTLSGLTFLSFLMGLQQNSGGTSTVMNRRPQRAQLSAGNSCLVRISCSECDLMLGAQGPGG